MQGRHFLPQSSPQVPARTRKSINKMPCEEGKEWGQQDQCRRSSVLRDGLNWHKGSCTFLPQPPIRTRVRIYTARTHIYLGMRTCTPRVHIYPGMRRHAHTTQVCDFRRLLLFSVPHRGRWY